MDCKKKWVKDGLYWVKITFILSKNYINIE